MCHCTAVKKVLSFSLNHTLSISLSLTQIVNQFCSNFEQIRWRKSSFSEYKIGAQVRPEKTEILLYRLHGNEIVKLF